MVVHNGTCAFGAAVKPLVSTNIISAAPPATEELPAAPAAPTRTTTTTSKPVPKSTLAEAFNPPQTPVPAVLPKPFGQPYPMMGQNEYNGYYLQPGIASPVLPAPSQPMQPLGNAQFMIPGAPGLYLPNAPGQGFPQVFVPEPTNSPLFPYDEVRPPSPVGNGYPKQGEYQPFPLLPGLLPAGIRQESGSAVNAKPKPKSGIYADKPPRPVAAPLAAVSRPDAILAPPGSACGKFLNWRAVAICI